MTECEILEALNGFELTVEKRKRCRPHCHGPWEAHFYDKFKPLCCVSYGKTHAEVIESVFEHVYKHVTRH